MRSHEAHDVAGQEVLVVHAHVARHAGVLLAERLRHGLQLGAHLDEAVQVHRPPLARRGKALHHPLDELRAQVVAHLGQGCGTEGRPHHRLLGICTYRLE